MTKKHTCFLTTNGWNDIAVRCYVNGKQAYIRLFPDRKSAEGFIDTQVRWFHYEEVFPWEGYHDSDTQCFTPWPETTE